MKVKIFGPLLVLVLVSFSTQAGVETKKKMRGLLDSYIQLVPHIYGDDINESSVEVKLKNLEIALKNTQHDAMLSSPNFSPLVSILNESIKDIRASHNKGMYRFSQARLKNIMTVCTTCHSQLPATAFNKIQTSYKKLLDKHIKDDYDRAMTDYFLRDYQSSIAYLTKVLHKGDNKSKGNLKKKKRLNEILKIYLMNLKDTDATLSFLNKEKKNFKSNKQLNELIDDWTQNLNTWKKNKISNKVSDAQLKLLITNNLTPIEDMISYGNISAHAPILYSMQGILSDFAVSNKNSPLIPEVLYWLGLIENQSHTLYLYSLGDLYLKQCILKYSKSSMGKKCYQAYHDSIVYGFTGSSGTNIPLDVRRELESLKAKVIK